MRTVGCASASPTSRAACPGADTTLQDFAGASCTSSYASLPASQASGETARGGDRDRLEQTPPRCHPLDLGVVLSSPPGSVRSAKAPSSAGRSSIVLGLHPAPSAADLCGSASARSLRSEHSRSPGPDVSAGGVKRALFQAASRSGSGPRRFGPGSAPKRCPGLGAPTRRVPSSGSRASFGGACGGGRASLGGGGRSSLGGAPGGHRLSLGAAPAHGQLYRSPRTAGDLDEGLSAALQQSLAEAPRPPSQGTSAAFCAPRRGSTSPSAPTLQAAAIEVKAADSCRRTGIRPRRPPSPRIKGLVDKFEGGPRFDFGTAAPAAKGRAPAPVAFFGCASPLREASRRVA